MSKAELQVEALTSICMLALQHIETTARFLPQNLQQEQRELIEKMRDTVKYVAS